MFFTAPRFVSLFSVLLSRFFSALWLAVLLCAHLFVALASSPLFSSSVLENHNTKENTGTMQFNNRLVLDLLRRDRPSLPCSWDNRTDQLCWCQICWCQIYNWSAHCATCGGKLKQV